MKHMNETAIEQAFRLSHIAKELFTALRSTDCHCVETKEYVEWRQNCEKYVVDNTTDISNMWERADRRIEFMLSEPFDGKEVEVDCPRCSAMLKYEDFCAEDNGDAYLYIDGQGND
jgi:hypothetical protein